MSIKNDSDDEYSISIQSNPGQAFDPAFRQHTATLVTEVKSFLQNLTEKEEQRDYRSSSWWGFKHHKTQQPPMGQLIALDKDNDNKDNQESEKLFLLPWIFNPNHYVRQSWDVVFVLGSIIYTALRVPYAIAYDVDEFAEVDVWFVLNRIIDLIFILDITVIFLTGRKNGRKVVVDHSSIAWEYFKTWFIFDLAASIPLDLIIWIASSSDGSTGAASRSGKLVRVIKIFRTFRILRLFKLQRVILSMQLFFGWNFEFVSIGKFVFAIALLAHLITCGFLWVGDHDGWLVHIEHETGGSKYLASFFWTMTTMTTIGYGDFVALTTNERLFSCFAMLIGAVTFTFGVTRIVHIMASMKKSQAMLVQQMEGVSEWSKHHEFPTQLEQTVKNYLHYRGSQTYFDENGVLSGLSESLRRKVLRHIYETSLKRVDIFSHVSNEFLDDLMCHIRVEFAAPYSVIISEGSIGSSMYIIRRGVVAVYKQNQEKNITNKNIVLLGRSQSFGETALIASHKTRTASVVALEWTDLAVIDREDFVNIMEKFPVDKINLQRHTEVKMKSFYVANEKSHPLSKNGIVDTDSNDSLNEQLEKAENNAAVKLDEEMKQQQEELAIVQAEELEELKKVFGTDPVALKLQNMINNVTKLQHKWLQHVKQKQTRSVSRRRSSI